MTTDPRHQLQQLVVSNMTRVLTPDELIEFTRVTGEAHGFAADVIDAVGSQLANVLRGHAGSSTEAPAAPMAPAPPAAPSFEMPALSPPPGPITTTPLTFNEPQFGMPNFQPIQGTNPFGAVTSPGGVSVPTPFPAGANIPPTTGQQPTGGFAYGATGLSGHEAAFGMPGFESFGTEKSAPPALPRLRVDWGQDMQIGKRACPEFTILCPPHYSGRPRVAVEVDKCLDASPEANRPVPMQESDGSWKFDVPFSLSTQGTDCRAGRYKFELSIAFSDVPVELPRYFLCRLYITVNERGEGSGPTLEIEGDGQSVVNLAGGDLSRFSTVRLKGKEGAIVNVQDPLAGILPKSNAGADPAPTLDHLVSEYELRVDDRKQRALPRVSTRFRQRKTLDTASLVTAGGQHVHIHALGKLRMGRLRENEIVTRHLPRNEQNDLRSLEISRVHATLELEETGLAVSDNASSRGTALERQRLAAKIVLTFRRLDEDISLDLATDKGLDALRLRLRLYGNPDNHQADELLQQDEVYAEILRTRRSKLWQLSHSSRIDAVRVKRVNNLTEEEYIALFRQALIGNSNEAPIFLDDPTVERRHARIFHLADGFWLEHLAPHGTTLVNRQQITQRELVPLVPGTELQFGETKMTFTECQQLHL